MSRRFTVIGAVLKKDLVVLWPIVLGNIVMIALVYLNGAGVFADTPLRVRQFLTFLPILAVVSSLILCFGAAHLDPVPGSAQDWPTRPITRIDLVLAKLAFLVLTIMAPLVIISFAAYLNNGRAVLESVALMATAWTALFLPPIVLAVAALTRNLLEAIAVCFCLLIMIIAAFGLGQLLMPMAEQVAFTGFSWIGGWAGFLLAAGFAIGFLFLQYGLRKVTLARLLAIPAIGLVLAATFLVPWDMALAIQRTISGKAEKPLALGPPQCVIVGRPTTQLTEGTQSYSSDEPFRVATTRIPVNGAPSGWLVLADRLDSPSGALPFVTPRLIGKPLAQNERLIATPIVLASSRGPGEIIDLEASISLMEPVRTTRFVLTGDRRYIADLGWCGVRTARGRRTLECSFWPSAQTTFLSVGGEVIDCPTCLPVQYAAPSPDLVRKVWRLPARVPAEVTLTTYRYHSTSQLRTSIERQRLLDPALACPPPQVQPLRPAA